MEKQENADIEIHTHQMGMLGEYLKQKRIDKNYTLEKLSQKTKISINILKYLESNDFRHLPSAAYIKGFVTSYVKVLGLPLEEAINKMEYTYLNVLGKPFPALNHTKLMNSTPGSSGKSLPINETSNPHDVIESGDSIIENTKSMLPILIFGAIILLFVGGYKLISSVIEKEVSRNKARDLGPKIESSSALVTENKSKELNNKTSSSPKVDQQSVSEKSPVAETTKVTTEDQSTTQEFPRNFPTVDFKKVRGKTFTVKMDAPENTDTEMFPSKFRDSMNSEMQNLYIRALDGNTWLSYKIDNNPIVSIIINKGNDLFIQGNEIRIFLGNVNVTKIFYNNYLIDTPTRSGVKSLIFPEESNSKYHLPLFPKANDDILYTAEDYMKRMQLEEEEIKKLKKN